MPVRGLVFLPESSGLASNVTPQWSLFFGMRGVPSGLLRLQLLSECFQCCLLKIVYRNTSGWARPIRQSVYGLGAANMLATFATYLSR
jgi:hypothetical protein